MKIAVKDLNQVISDYLDTEVLPKADTLKKFAITLAFLQMQNKIPKYLSYLVPFSDDGYLDLEFTKKNFLTALEKAGGIINIPYVNYNIDKTDIDSLFKLAERYAK